MAHELASECSLEITNIAVEELEIDTEDTKLFLFQRCQQTTKKEIPRLIGGALYKVSIDEVVEDFRAKFKDICKNTIKDYFLKLKKNLSKLQFVTS